MSHKWAELYQDRLGSAAERRDAADTKMMARRTHRNVMHHHVCAYVRAGEQGGELGHLLRSDDLIGAASQLLRRTKSQLAEKTSSSSSLSLVVGGATAASNVHLGQARLSLLDLIAGDVESGAGAASAGAQRRSFDLALEDKTASPTARKLTSASPRASRAVEKARGSVQIDVQFFPAEEGNGEDDGGGAKTTLFVHHFLSKNDRLPRQARDNHLVRKVEGTVVYVCVFVQLQRASLCSVTAEGPHWTSPAIRTSEQERKSRVVKL